MKNKKALFLVNSLSNGGAERVCINMANELIKKQFDVDFIILGKNDKNKYTYDINEKIKIYDLKINTTNRLKKLLKIVSASRKINKIVKENEKDCKYELITSHLPMANVLTRFSKIKNRAIYVFHTKVSSYNKIGNEKLFKMVIKFIYGNKKVVAVSEEVRREAIDNYNIKENNIKTIYNPINIEEINLKKEEEISIDNKYFVQIGRFNEAKRQDRMIDVFYKGEFYKKYKLVFCGTGELEEQAKNKIKALGLEESVIFMGWQSNVYKWMKNAELLISTSDYEAFPMNLIEALICGTKIVSSNCKFGPNEILLGEYAKYLVKPDNIDDYIDKINMALESYPTSENPIIKKCIASNIIKEYLDFMKQERVEQ